jgi:hypothetical protein
MRRLSAFVAELSGLGSAFVDVLRAEWATLTADLGASGRLLVRGVVLLCLAAGLVAWSVGLLSLALIAFLERYLEPWAAAAVVGAGLLLIALVIFVVARSVLRRVEPPDLVVRRRVQSHLDWLGSQLDGADATPDEEDAADVRG